MNYAYTVRDKVRENELVMTQIANNTPEQALLGDFSKELYNAIIDSSEVHQHMKIQLLSDPAKSEAFAKVVFNLLKIAG
ncbi:MAG: hypothetical protein J7L71_09385 [Spirochaetaceae bacterium]|nr:hypothetical protein [Spirochaetaceae bacterium]